MRAINGEPRGGLYASGFLNLAQPRQVGSASRSNLVPDPRSLSILDDIEVGDQPIGGDVNQDEMVAIVVHQPIVQDTTDIAFVALDFAAAHVLVGEEDDGPCVCQFPRSAPSFKIGALRQP